MPYWRRKEANKKERKDVKKKNNRKNKSQQPVLTFLVAQVPSE